MKYKKAQESVYEKIREAQEDQRNEILELLSIGNYEKALTEAALYVEMKKNKVIVLQNREDNSYLFLEYKTRFSQAYKSLVKRKLKTILDNKKTCIGHLTLTIQNLSFTDLINLKKNISTAFNQFIQALNRYCKEKNITRDKIKYLSTREITISNTSDNLQNLHYHIHLILFEFRFLSKLDLDHIKEIWFMICQNNSLIAKYVFYKYTSNNNALYYALKYVCKEFIEINLTSTILHFLKIRSYTTSERIRLDNKAQAQSRYAFIGIYNIEDTERLFQYIRPIEFIENPPPAIAPSEAYPEPIKIPTYYIENRPC